VFESAEYTAQYGEGERIPPEIQAYLKSQLGVTNSK